MGGKVVVNVAEWVVLVVLDESVVNLVSFDLILL
jgi:hypothetical protein